MWKQKEAELNRQAWRHLDMTDTWHTRTKSKAVHKTNYEPESFLISMEFIMNFIGNAGNISGKQRTDFVRRQLLLLAQGSPAEIKGSRFDMLHNFDKRIKYLKTVAEELGVEDPAFARI